MREHLLDPVGGEGNVKLGGDLLGLRAARVAQGEDLHAGDGLIDADVRLPERARADDGDADVVGGGSHEKASGCRAQAWTG
jgi:hypothetical protein